MRERPRAVSGPQSKQKGWGQVSLFLRRSAPQLFSPSLTFGSLKSLGSLKSFRKEAHLAGMFFVPASLFTEEKGGGRFIITALGGWCWGAGGGGRGSDKKFQPARQCMVFCCGCFRGLHCATNSFGATRSPSLSLCRLARAGGGTVKFQHLLHRTSNYYTRLLRQPSTAPPASPQPPGVPHSALGRGPPGEGERAPNSAEAWGFPRPAQLLRCRHQGGGEPAPCRHTRIHAYSGAVSVHILAHRPPPSPRAPGVAELGGVTGAPRQPAPGRAGRSGARGQLRRVFRRPKRWRGWDSGRSPSLGRGGDGCHQ